MLYNTIVISYIFSFIVCLGDIITNTPIGVIHEVTGDNDAGEADSAYLEAVLRRRLLPGGLTTADKTVILNVHNMYRNMTAQGNTPNHPSAKNMNQLVWDSNLAKVAQNYSQQCIWAHNPNRNSQMKQYATSSSFNYVNQVVGENLFISTGSESMSTILSGIKYWYNEYKYFTFGTISGTGKCVSGQECGHYTQLVWGLTRYVGCSYTKCATVKNLPTFTNAILFACDYYFAGNFVGDYPYESGSSCANCPHDRGTCRDGICTGCPNPAYDTYCCEYCSTSTCSNAITSGLVNSPTTCNNGITADIPSSVITITSSPIDNSTTPSPTTAKPTTQSPTTAKPTTQSPTTAKPTTESPTTAKPTTESPTTAKPTTQSPTTAKPTTQSPTTAKPTTQSPTTGHPTTGHPTTNSPTARPTTKSPTSKHCCFAHKSIESSICTHLSSTQCQSTRGCYWDASC
jgi:hypothetical protein